jgi:predicted regulator of Ras-like GTPase activity (Roadblock/LC7/MglB family)
LSTVDDETRQKMMYVLKAEENKTDLENLQVLSRVGMKVASALSSELDADATSASSTALIDLGLRLNQATDHGALTEIVLHNAAGYSILMAINDEFIVFGGLRAIYRIGYYLGYLREVARKLNRLLSGDEATEMMLSLESSELEKLEQQIKEEEGEGIKKPSVEQDKAALDDLLGFLDDWEKDGAGFEELETENETNIVSIPQSVGLAVKNEVKQKIGSAAPQKTTSSTLAVEEDFQVYDDETPPVPLEDYTPMEIEENLLSEEIEHNEMQVSQPPIEEKIPTSKKSPPLDELPSLEELAPPDFDFETSASEYDTEFVLEEESEALGSVLKELGWTDEDE